MKMIKLLKLYPSSLRIGSPNASINSYFERRYSNSNTKLEADDGKLNPTVAQKMRLVKLEMEAERQMGNFFIPNEIGSKDWPIVLNMNSPEIRKGFYRYLKKKEIHDVRDKEKHARRVLERRTREEERKMKNPDHIQYGLGKNTIFMKIYPRTMNQFYNGRFVHAITFGQNVIIDMGYEDAMNNQELTNTIDQIVTSYAALKRDRDPFHLHFCNVDPNGQTLPKLKLALPILQQEKPLITLTAKSPLDLFPKEKLVYLSSHCDRDLEFSHDDVYIIGGLVDKRAQGPLSLAKAKREGLRMARFPFSEHLDWGCGHKSLTLDQVMKILLTMSNTMDWKKAFEHVPKRKLVKIQPVQPRTFPFKVVPVPDENANKDEKTFNLLSNSNKILK